jgi:hypothetical protein
MEASSLCYVCPPFLGRGLLNGPIEPLCSGVPSKLGPDCFFEIITKAEMQNPPSGISLILGSGESFLKPVNFLSVGIEVHAKVAVRTITGFG